MQTFPLPTAIAELIAARNKLRDHYGQILAAKGSRVALSFTLDGNLVGDLGEAIAAELFDIKLVETRSAQGVDGYGPDGRTVQVKATGTGRGPAFRCTEVCADHLLFFDLDFERCAITVLFNGPEHYIRKLLPQTFVNQRSLARSQILHADGRIREDERLQVVARPGPANS